MDTKVIIVNEDDRQLDVMGKLDAHISGTLHRAFSVILINSKKEMLIHQRAFSKYHSPGLWTNTCCSHPVPGIPINICAKDRLVYEMGVHADLHFAFSFTYRAELSNGLIENEIDHVFFGYYDGVPIINSDEVAAYKWVHMDTLKNNIELRTEIYTEWFKTLMSCHFNTIAKYASTLHKSV